jgi:hypothetical protein
MIDNMFRQKDTGAAEEAKGHAILNTLLANRETAPLGMSNPIIHHQMGDFGLMTNVG